MDEFWREQMASGFAAFRGAHLTGSLPISDTLITELIQDWLARTAAAPAAAAAGGGPPVDLGTVARLVRHAAVRATDGVVTVDFEVGV